jgi:hypothetical protein
MPVSRRSRVHLTGETDLSFARVADDSPAIDPSPKAILKFPRSQYWSAL